MATPTNPPTAITEVSDSDENVQVVHSPAIWAQLAQSGFDLSRVRLASSLIKVVHVGEDDIIQKSLDISGISQDTVVDNVRTPKADHMELAIERSSPTITFSGSEEKSSDPVTDAPNNESNSDVTVAKKCNLCDEEFDSVRALGEHFKKTHIEDCPFECASCNALFRLPTHLQKHVRSCKIANQLKSFPCPKCDRAFDKSIALRRHMTQHDEEKQRFVCDICQKSFASEAYMEKHKRSHSEAKTDDPKETPTEVQVHEDNVNDVESGVEDGGGRHLRRRRCRINMAELLESENEDSDKDENIDQDDAVLLTSSQDSPSENTVKVTKSSTVKVKKIGLSKDQKPVVQKTKKLRCGKCEQLFDSQEERTQHVQLHTVGNNEHMCVVCGKTYTMSCNLERHFLIHTNVRMHKCDVCGKGFHRVDILDRHRRIHTGEKPHECPTCGSKFISKSALLIHSKRVHSERPFSCTVCAESFFTQDRLQRHMKVHESNRHYSCDKCGKSFINSGNLKTHMRVHTKEKPFECEHCGERFKQKAHVERHFLIHTRAPKKDDPVLKQQDIAEVRKLLHFCKVCGKSFPKRRGLRMHERMRHGIARTVSLKPAVARDVQSDAQNKKVLPLPTNNDSRTILPTFQQHTWFPPVNQQQQQPLQRLQQPLQQHQQPLQHHQQQQLHQPPMIAPHQAETVQHQAHPHQSLRHILLQDDQPIQQSQQLQQMHPHQQHQQPQQYSVSVFNDNGTVVFNDDGTVYSQQYLPQNVNQPYDIQIQNLDEPVVITAGDSHDTIMYLIEAAATGDIINTTLDTNPQEIHIISQPDDVDTPFGSVDSVQLNNVPVMNNQVQQIDALSGNHLSQGQKLPPSSEIFKRPRTDKPRARIEKNAVGAKPYKCDICNDHFNTSSVLVKHIRTHTGEKPFTCQTCGKSFSQIGNLHRHVKSHQGIRNHSCSICGKTFTRRERLLYHAQLHTGVKNYKCTECGKEFAHKINLVAHFNRTHSKHKPHKCDQCDKCYADMRSLLNHKKSHEYRNAPKTHSCSMCERAFVDKRRLDKHMRVHTNWRPHKCTQCDRSYTLLSSLKNHTILRHTPEPEHPFLCPVCNLPFKTKYQMQTHVKIHEEPKFECDVCGKKFTGSTNLTMHKRIHNGERPFKCENCGRTFTQRGHLLRHGKTCTNRKHKCYECPSSFYAWESLVKHIKKYHGVESKSHACDLCELHFSSATSLEKHIETVHNAAHRCSSCKTNFDSDVALKEHTCTNTDVKIESDDVHQCGDCGEEFGSLEELGNHSSVCDYKKFDKYKTKQKNSMSENAAAGKGDEVSGQKLRVKVSNLVQRPKPFKCASCDKCFNLIHQLTNHSKTHIGEKYECSNCGVAFGSKSILTEHQETCQSDKASHENASDGRTDEDPMTVLLEENITHKGMDSVTAAPGDEPSNVTEGVP